MQVREWEPWHQDLDYGTMMQQRAMQHEPEMEQAKQLIKLFRPCYRPGISIVDAGCGAGHFYPSLLTAGEQLSYLGVDITEPYIKLAQETFRNDNRAKFVITDMFNMGIADASFDIGLCYMVLPFLPDYRKATQELFRVVRQHAFFRLLLSDHTYIIKRFKNHSNGEQENPSFVYYNIYSQQEFTNYLCDLGAKDIQIYDDEFNLSFAKRDGWSTYTYGDLQISGNLVMTWKVIRASKGDISHRGRRS